MCLLEISNTFIVFRLEMYILVNFFNSTEIGKITSLYCVFHDMFSYNAIYLFYWKYKIQTHRWSSWHFHTKQHSCNCLSNLKDNLIEIHFAFLVTFIKNEFILSMAIINDTRQERLHRLHRIPTFCHYILAVINVKNLIESPDLYNLELCCCFYSVHVITLIKMNIL